MKNAPIITLLSQDSFIMYNIQLATKIGVNEAILIGELARKYNYWHIKDRLTEDGYFFVTHEDIKLDTGLSIYAIKKAINNLQELNILLVNKKGGVDRSNYYKLNEIALLDYINLE